MVKKVTPITGGGSGDGKPPAEPGSDHKVTSEDLVSIAKALEGDLDANEMSSEEIEKISKAFGKMFVAEMRGEDLEDHFDPDEIQPAVNDKVADAVKRYCDSKNLSFTPSQYSEQKKIAELFQPKQTVPGNKHYRALTQDGQYRLNIFDSVFVKYRNYRGYIDKDALEKMFRRLDAEVRTLDPVLREELLFTFINAILSNDVAQTGTFTEPEDYNMLKPESRQLVHDLALLYLDVREHGRVAQKGYEKINKRFNAESINAVADLNIEDIMVFSNHSDSIRPVRSIRPKTYYLILQLVRSLSAALPAKLQVALDNMLKEERGTSLDAGTINGRLFNPSKYLRRAFIALVQGRGSFEAFFTALMDVRNILENDLNNRIAAARALVDTYDSLGLDIVNVLQNSARRILSKSLI